MNSEWSVDELERRRLNSHEALDGHATVVIDETEIEKGKD